MIRVEPTPADIEAKKQKRHEYEQRRSQTPERKEAMRRYAQEHRRKAKETGTCVSCPNPAIPSHTRCSTCTAQHQVSRRRSQAQRKERVKEGTTQ